LGSQNLKLPTGVILDMWSKEIAEKNKFMTRFRLGFGPYKTLIGLLLSEENEFRINLTYLGNTYVL
jgi:hypothetical protein